MMHSRVPSIALACALAASAASAQNTTPATALPTAPGQVRVVSAAASTSYYYDVFLFADRSYAAMCWNEDLKSGSGGGVIPRCIVSFRDSADAAVGNGFQNFDEPIAPGGTWDTLTPATQGNYLVRATTNTGSAGTIKVVLVETTLFSPWFFISSASGYESYVEIKNATRRTVNVTVKAFAANGSQAGVSVTRAIPAAGNTYVTVGGNVGATGSGGIQITSDGPPGAIVANVTTISGMTGLSFDAPCQPRMQWSLFP